MTEIKRVLVANRGEIALRVIRACHEEGMAAVAVYSEVDRLSPHVRAADAAVAIGPAPAAESYLDAAKLVAAARDSGCQAIHPGYGFLSERAPFAEAVMEAGLTFVGPSPAAIRAMGDKTEARRRMQAAGVPIVPGTTRPLADHAQARPEAARLGYPVLLKAVAGGGGKGMRLVRTEAELESAFETAQSEALKAFGAGEGYLEKYLERARHIEIQGLGDSFGRVVAPGERECSIQRRHQKLIEEAPSLAVTPALRRRLSDAAAAAAGAVGYVSAGTIEFLLAASGEFYFLEMNTRLQVEHPVTELVYGVDIVREQLRVATGQPLRVHAGTLQPRGHAIECRIMAEDPFNDFLPVTGVVRHLRVPGGPGVRWDAGFETGNEVTLHYDSLMAKLIAWGETRAVALERMRRALRERVIGGLPTPPAGGWPPRSPTAAPGTSPISPGRGPACCRRRPGPISPARSPSWPRCSPTSGARPRHRLHHPPPIRPTAPPPGFWPPDGKPCGATHERHRGDHVDRGGGGRRGPAGRRAGGGRAAHRAGQIGPAARRGEAAQELRAGGAGRGGRARGGGRARHAALSALPAGPLRRLPAAARGLRRSAGGEARDRGRRAAPHRQARRPGSRDRGSRGGMALPGEDQFGGERRWRAAEDGGIPSERPPRYSVPAHRLSHRRLPADGAVARAQAAPRPLAREAGAPHAAARPRGPAACDRRVGGRALGGARRGGARGRPARSRQPRPLGAAGDRRGHGGGRSRDRIPGHGVRAGEF